MTFQIHALEPSKFTHLSNMNDIELARNHALWVEVDTKPGFPCRVSLDDAPVGTRLLLVNFDHHTAQSPYRSSHAIYVNPEATKATPPPGTVPPSISSRLISWRAFDKRGLMVDADVLEGEQLVSRIPQILNNEAVDYIHLHNARPGCYAAKVTRV